jgi:protein associated with RNAse G/E
MLLLGFEPGTFSIQVTSVTALTTLLGVNVDKTKYMLLSRHQNAGQNHNINISNRFCANEAELKYLKMTVTTEIAFTGKSGTY